MALQTQAIVSLDTLLYFCATEMLLCITPGPAVLLVVSLSLSRGASGGLRAAAGILVANTLYFAISATGIGALLLTSFELFFLVEWLGAAYLVWLGLRALLAGRARQLARHERFALGAERLGGALLIGAGAGLAALDRSR